MKITISTASAQQHLAASSAALDKTLAALASGRRINAAGDDAAGLGVATQLSSQARSYLVAQRNANDGISMLGSADAAVSTQADLVGRLRELAVQASSDTVGPEGRAAIEAERSQLTAEVDRIAGSTQFNGESLLTGGTTATFQVGPNATPNDAISVKFGDTTAQGLKLDALRFDTAAGAQASLSALDGALSSISSARGDIGAAQNRLGSAIQTAQGSFQNLTAAEGRITDTDVAAAASALVSNQIRTRAGLAVLSQAARLQPSALGLLK